ncbi:Mediator Of Rna polymerase Ii Transcription Subunit 24 [Manis pentadactyla]|nr:Mediator Of Rna polymerase Ii Transcription Subunit 24 [Manis pentadactyla]
MSLAETQTEQPWAEGKVEGRVEAKWRVATGLFLDIPQLLVLVQVISHHAQPNQEWDPEQTPQELRDCCTQDEDGDFDCPGLC